MNQRVTVDVDALYGKALSRLGDVGRFLDELRQLRASKGNGKHAFAEAAAPDPGPDDEDTEDEDEVTARCFPVDDR